MVKKDYSQLTDKKLIQIILDLNRSLQKSFFNHAPKNLHFQRNIKKEIARIKTEQTKRK